MLGRFKAVYAALSAFIKRLDFRALIEGRTPLICRLKVWVKDLVTAKKQRQNRDAALSKKLKFWRVEPGRAFIFAFFILIIVFSNSRGEPVLMRGIAAGTMGGPEEIIKEPSLNALQKSTPPLLYDTLSALAHNSGSTLFEEQLVLFGDTVGGMFDPAGDLSLWASEAAEIITHTVSEGETIAAIAERYDVSVQTILWANNLTPASRINPGNVLRFPSISGVLHRVRSGQTLSGIAATYGVSMDRIQAANPRIAFENLRIGDDLIIPGGRPAAATARGPAPSEREVHATAPSRAVGYFIMPTTGLNWGRLHFYNATDIANVCGTPVWAAASGVVSRVAYGGWNGGYGNMMMITHPNGMRTLYAHLQSILVENGVPVTQGEQIATIGNTGRVKGPTGCHLHFEVRGGVNPFIRHR